MHLRAHSRIVRKRRLSQFSSPPKLRPAVCVPWPQTTLPVPTESSGYVPEPKRLLGSERGYSTLPTDQSPSELLDRGFDRSKSTPPEGRGESLDQMAQPIR